MSNEAFSAVKAARTCIDRAVGAAAAQSNTSSSSSGQVLSEQHSWQCDVQRFEFYLVCSFVAAAGC
jgi:hypothetical protein